MEVAMGSRNEIMREANFWSSRVILTAAELDVFTHLDGGPLTSLEVAHRIGSDPRATDRLLNALVALDLLEKREALFSLSGDGKLLSSNHPKTVLPTLLHYNGLWESWSQLTTVVREGKPARRTRRKRDDGSRKAFIGAMDSAGRELSLKIADAFDASHFRRLLDIGGASGTYTIAFLRKNTQMTGVLFDLPQVIAIAREKLKNEGLTDRVVVMPGDYNNDPLPTGCDLALLSAVIHQNSPSENLDLFTKIQRALEPGGVLLIRDFVMDSTRTMPKRGALFALNMLVNTVAGDTYTFDEISESLRKAGFIDVTLLKGSDQQDDLVKALKEAK
jgi:SAM-dependent methyltransferase